MLGSLKTLPLCLVLLVSLIVFGLRLSLGPIADGDISNRPFSVPMLVKCAAFLSALRWPEGLKEMGKFGISHVEVLILFETWVGHRLLREKTVPMSRRTGRSITSGCAPV